MPPAVRRWSRSARSLSVVARAAALLGLCAAPLAAQLSLGQSFTASASPTTVLRRLHVDPTGLIGSSGGAPYSADIYALSGGSPVGGSLFSQVLGTSAAGLDLFPNIVLTPGASYAVLVGGGSSPVTTFFNADTYAGGANYYCDVGVGCGTFGDNDLNGLFLDFGLPTTDPRSMLGQSFTAPSGPNTLLQQLTIGATGLIGSSSGAPYSADIYTLSGGALVGNSLFSQVLGTSVRGLTLFPNIALTPGGTYAVLVSGGNGSFYTTFDADTYAAGGAYTCFAGSDCSSFGDSDLNGFGLRFGRATTTPEPGASALVGAGLLAFGAVTTRRRRRA